MPDKMLAAQIVRIGEELEIVSLSAEATVGWERILDEVVPVDSGRIRLYAGYLGALFGYLPTAAQVPEGGYEVAGFQALFGLSGDFKSDRIDPAVAGCVKEILTLRRELLEERLVGGRIRWLPRPRAAQLSVQRAGCGHAVEDASIVEGLPR